MEGTLAYKLHLAGTSRPGNGGLQGSWGQQEGRRPLPPVALPTYLGRSLEGGGDKPLLVFCWVPAQCMKGSRCAIYREDLNLEEYHSFHCINCLEISPMFYAYLKECVPKPPTLWLTIQNQDAFGTQSR